MNKEFYKKAAYLVAALLFIVFFNQALCATELTTGSISGRVTDEAGNGLASIAVLLYESNAPTPLAVTFTGDNGRYTHTGLAEGSYKIFFRESSASATHIEEWYNDTTRFDVAEVIPVTAVSPIMTEINAELALGGSISGRVTNAAGNGIANVSLQVFDSSSRAFGYKAFASTDGDGNYTVSGLPTDSYKIFYSSSQYAQEWYRDASRFALANSVTVTAPQTTFGVDAVLSVGGSITGRVTDNSGNGIKDVHVMACDSISSITIDNSVFTGSDGRYTLPMLASGTYRIEFSATRLNESTGSNYISTWYSSANNFSDADLVSVTESNVTDNVDAVLSVGGRISGRVTDEENTPLDFVEITIHDSSTYTLYESIELANTEADGTYTVTGLPVGSYKVEVNTYWMNYNNGSNYANAWYSNGTSFADAEIVQVAAPDAITSGVDIVLTDGGSLSGSVTDKNGESLADIRVYAYNSSGYPVGSAYTDLDGQYTLTGLPAGDYAVWFDTFARNLLDGDRCIDEWYSDKVVFSEVDPVTVAAPNTTTSGIDAVLQRQENNSLMPILQLLLLSN